MILINLTRTKTLKSPNMSVLFPFSHFHDNQTHFKEKSQNSRQNHHDRRHNLNLYNIFFSLKPFTIQSLTQNQL